MDNNILDALLDENQHPIRSKLINQLEWAIISFEGIYVVYLLVVNYIYYPDYYIHPFFAVTTLPCIYAVVWRYWSIRFDAYQAPFLRDNKTMMIFSIVVFVLGFASSPFLIGIPYMVYATRTQAAMKRIARP